jgi:glycosyltransferase involved in cell wall biosynthesis
MKIFFVNNFSPQEVIGGSEIQCWLLAKHLAKRGHQTAYLALRGLAGQRQELEDGFKVYYLAGENDNKLKIFVNFYRLLKKEKPDICYIRIFKHLFLLNKIAKFLRIPVVFNTSHINDCQPDLEEIKFSLNPLKFLKSIRIVIQRHLNFSTFKKINIVTINKYQAKLLKEKYQIEATPIYNSMEYKGEGKQVKKEKWVVWANNIKGRKKPEEFIWLVNQFKNSQYQFLMIGNIQSESDYYEKMIGKCQEENSNFKYLGGKSPEEVDKILAASEILVNTCQPEGFGNNFTQAWFNKCPTITLSFDPDDIIKKNGIGFHSVTREQMKKDLQKLMDNDKLRIVMGERAKKYALKNHNIVNNVKTYEEKFKKIIYESHNKKN